MKVLFPLFTFIFLPSILLAQTYVKPRAITTDPNSCNSVVVCEMYGMSPHGYINRNNGFPSPQVLVNHMDTLTDFCFYEAGNPNNHELEFFSSNGYINHYRTNSTLITPEFNYTISSYIEPTNETSTDGSFVITFDSSVTAFTYLFEQDGGYVPNVTILDAYSFSITNANEGYITIYVQDPGDIYNYANFRILLGNPNNIYVNTGLDLNISFQHAGLGCTGWINIQAVAPLGDVQAIWADGVYDEETRLNLCPGIYSAYTYDWVGGTYASGHIDTLVLTNDSLTYIDTNLFSMVPQDTSYYFTNTCFFDYYEPIDSVFYSEDTVYYSAPLLIATFEMIIYQGNNMITFTDSLITLSDSTVLLDVVVYCTEFKSAFTGQRIMFLRGADNHYFSSPFVSVQENEKSSVTNLYPNPVQNELNLNFGERGNYKIQLIDYQGKVLETFDIYDEKNVQFQTDQLDNGLYILLILSEKGNEQIKFVKNNN